MIKEELERIIKDSTRISEMQIKHLAQAILDAGFVRLEDVVVDKRRLRKVLKQRLQDCFEQMHDSEDEVANYNAVAEDLNQLTTAIAEAKGIIRVKEG